MRARKGRTNSRYQQTRILIDGGAQSTFISEKLAFKLKLDLKPTNETYTGIGDVTAKVLGTTEIYLQSQHGKEGLMVRANVVP